MTEIDLATGEQTDKSMTWGMLPPPADCCQICGRKHEPDQPHDVQQLRYQMLFHNQIGRYPTWADAIAHCAPKVAAAWENILRHDGHWTEPPKGEPAVKHHGVE